MIDPKAQARFWSKVDRRGPDDCWEWQGPLYSGYGKASWNKRSAGAHRLSAILHGLPVRPGMMVDHICRNRACVNPGHLRVVTPRINSIENSIGPTAKNYVKTHCDRGHELSDDNLIQVTLIKKGWRSCKTCKAIWNDNKPRKTSRRCAAKSPA